MIVVLIILYVLASGLTGFMGRHTTIGFVGHFFLSLLITPILDFIILVITRPNREIRRKLEELEE